MKCVTVTIEIDCADDIPQHVIDWMGDNLGEHAAHEFERDYDPEWTGFEGPPIAGHVTHTVSVRPLSAAYVRALKAAETADTRAIKEFCEEAARAQRAGEVPRSAEAFLRGLDAGQAHIERE